MKRDDSMNKIDEINSLIKNNIDNAYLSGRRIRGDFENENLHKKNYRERQIFELLQNADDCGESCEQDVRVKFEIIRDGDTGLLAVTNTGEPFSVEGVGSLLVSSTSSKKHVDTIGYMGLGFRSVLNWTNDIKIVTEEFTVSFSEDNARAKFDDCKGRMTSGASELGGMDRTAILASCRAETTGAGDKERWLSDGYVTAILLKCNEACLDEIQSDLDKDHFRPEELLFLKHIAKVEIKTPKGDRTICVEKHEDASDKGYDEIKLEDCGSDGVETSSEWYVFRKRSEVEDAGDDEESVLADKKRSKFEIAVAYNRDETKRREIRDKTGYLYSYFRTDIRMPLPFLIHGNFSLNDSRTSLTPDDDRVSDKQNQCVFDAIVDFVCEISLKIPDIVHGGKSVVDYTVLSALIPAETYKSGILFQYGFLENLASRTKELRILPSINDEYIGLCDCPKYSEQFVEDGAEKTYLADIVDKKTFRLLLKRCDDSVVTGYLEDNDVSEYSASDLNHLINQNAEEYVADKRYISLLMLLCKYYYSDRETSESAHLFLDSDGKLIEEDDSKIFIRGSESGSNLPDWAHIRYMNSKTFKELRPYFGSDARIMAKNLSAFGCREYNAVEVLQELKNQSGRDSKRTRDVLRYIYRYWESNNRRLHSDVLLNLFVISNDGDVVPAAKCYFGDEYGCEREKNITKYMDGVRYVASIEDLGLVSDEDPSEESEEEDIIYFLNYIGVRELPRFKTVELSSDERRDFLDYVGSNSHGKHSKMQASGYGDIYSCSDVKGWTNLRVFVSSVDNLDTILEQADFCDILNWLMKMSESDELGNYINVDAEAGDFSRIEGVPWKGVKTRTIPNSQIFPWFKYKLATVPWVKIEDKKYSFSECTVGANDFYPTIQSLSMLDDNEIKEKTGGRTKNEVISLFKKLGMPERIVDLPKQTIYRLLMELPELKKEGDKEAVKSVLNLYSSMNQTFSDSSSEYSLNDLILDNEERRRFLKEGKILAKVEDRYEYLPMQEVYYVDRMARYSEDILKRYPRIPLSRNSGNNKIEKLFGVKPITKVELEIKQFRVHPLNAGYKNELKRQIPFVYATRLKVSDKSRRDLSVLKRMEIALTESAAIEIKHGDGETDVEDLDDYSFVIRDNVAYIKIPADILSIPQLRNSQGYHSVISDVISTFLNIETDNDFKYIFSQSPENNKKSFEKDDDGYYYGLAKKEFGGLDPESDFWESVASVMDGDADKIKDEYKPLLSSDFDYDNLSNSINIKSIKKLFADLGISVADFNEHSFSTISFARYNNESFERLKAECEDGYRLWLAEKLVNESPDNTKDDFDVQMRYYIREHDIGDGGVDFDPSKKFEETFGVAVNDLQNLSGDFKEILDELEKRLNKREKREKSGEDGAEGVSDASEHVAKAPKEPDYNGVKDKVDSRETATFYDETEGAPFVHIRSAISNGGRRRRNQTYDSETDVMRKENGFEAEYVVFKMLKEMEGAGQIDDLDWVSGNAEYAGVKPKFLASDVAGYDISFVDSNGTKHYVDVKGSSSTGAVRFSLSKNEFKMGMNTVQTQGEEYDIYFVPLGNDFLGYRVRRFDKFLVFDDSSESFFNNKRYSVDYKSFDVTMTGGASASESEDYIVEIGRDDEDGQT